MSQLKKAIQLLQDAADLWESWRWAEAEENHGLCACCYKLPTDCDKVIALVQRFETLKLRPDAVFPDLRTELRAITTAYIILGDRKGRLDEYIDVLMTAMTTKHTGARLAAAEALLGEWVESSWEIGAGSLSERTAAYFGHPPTPAGPVAGTVCACSSPGCSLCHP